MIKQYFYSKQTRRWILMFANIFTGLKVKTGKDSCGDDEFIDVPITYASKDRTVGSLAGSYTQNKQHSLPMMSCYLTNLELAPERRHGVNLLDRRTFMEQGDVFPNDLKSAERLMPVPYNGLFDLNIYASNTDQMFQMLEQILLVFDPDLQIQRSDKPFDWMKITKVELTGINNEENVPIGTDRRILIWTLNFNMPLWLSPPMNIKNEIVQSIRIRMNDPEALELDEINEDGISIPFNETIISEKKPYTPPIKTEQPRGGEFILQARAREFARIQEQIKQGSFPTDTIDN